MTAQARHIVTSLLLVFAASPAFSQMTERDVRARLDAVYAGKADQVSRELPALLRQNPRDAGVLYIQAVLTTDGTLAVKRYQEIADTYQQSVWADDALYKVYQYDYSLGLYKKADEVMEQLRSRYPQSIYVTGADAKGAKQDNGTMPAASSTEPSAAGKAAVSPVPVPAPIKIEKKAEAERKDAAAEISTPVQQAKPGAASGISTPVQQAKPGAQQAAAQGKFYVQVGVFSTEANARKAVEHYGAMTGRQPGMTPKTSGDKTLYIVRFEGFDTAESARAFSAELRTKHNIDSFVFPSPGPNANPKAR